MVCGQRPRSLQKAKQPGNSVGGSEWKSASHGGGPASDPSGPPSTDPSIFGRESSGATEVSATAPGGEPPAEPPSRSVVFPPGFPPVPGCSAAPPDPEGTEVSPPDS